MRGRLYTADEIFNAINDATNKVSKERPDAAEFLVMLIGGDIAYHVAEILGFDMEQLQEYCKQKIEELENGEGED